METTTKTEIVMKIAHAGLEIKQWRGTKVEAKTIKLNRETVAAVINSFVEHVNDAVIHGGRVYIRKWGVFIPVWRKACRRRDPRTGDPIDVPARLSVRFKPCSALKEALNA
jgi:nucleoid DNA-binding protein